MPTTFSGSNGEAVETETLSADSSPANGADGGTGKAYAVDDTCTAVDTVTCAKSITATGNALLKYSLRCITFDEKKTSVLNQSCQKLCLAVKCRRRYMSVGLVGETWARQRAFTTGGLEWTTRFSSTTTKMEDHGALAIPVHTVAVLYHPEAHSHGKDLHAVYGVDRRS